MHNKFTRENSFLKGKEKNEDHHQNHYSCTFLNTDKSKPGILYIDSTGLFTVLMMCIALYWMRSTPSSKE